MGCISAQTSSLSSIPQAHLKRLNIISQINHQLNINKKYEHIAKIHSSQLTGNGIRRTFAYDCLGTEQQLRVKRNQFWETRTNGNPQCWAIVRQAVNDKNEAEAIQFLKKNKILMLNDTLQLCVDLKTNSFNKYQVPIFCINQPLSYSSETIANQNLVIEYEDKLLDIKIRSTKFPNDDIELKEQASTDIQTIITTIRVMKELHQEKYTIRLFYNGRQLNPTKTLGNYNFISEHIMQAMIKQK